MLRTRCGNCSDVGRRREMPIGCLRVHPDWAWDPQAGMCPGWDSNLQPFGA